MKRSERVTQAIRSVLQRGFRQQDVQPPPPEQGEQPFPHAFQTVITLSCDRIPHDELVAMLLPVWQPDLKEEPENSYGGTLFVFEDEPGAEECIGVNEGFVQLSMAKGNPVASARRLTSVLEDNRVNIRELEIEMRGVSAVPAGVEFDVNKGLLSLLGGRDRVIEAKIPGILVEGAGYGFVGWHEETPYGVRYDPDVDDPSGKMAIQVSSRYRGGISPAQLELAVKAQLEYFKNLIQTPPQDILGLAA